MVQALTAYSRAENPWMLFARNKVVPSLQTSITQMLTAYILRLVNQ